MANFKVGETVVCICESSKWTTRVTHKKACCYLKKGDEVIINDIDQDGYLAFEGHYCDGGAINYHQPTQFEKKVSKLSMGFVRAEEIIAKNVDLILNN